MDLFGHPDGPSGESVEVDWGTYFGVASNFRTIVPKLPWVIRSPVGTLLEPSSNLRSKVFFGYPDGPFLESLELDWGSSGIDFNLGIPFQSCLGVFLESLGSILAILMAHIRSLWGDTSE